MSRLTGGLVAGGFTLGALLFTWWCSGFDFDHRNQDVGVGVFLVISIALIGAAVGAVLGGDGAP